MNPDAAAYPPVEHGHGPWIRAIVAVLVGVVVVVAVYFGQVLQGTDATFVEMGFDADRARLISALVLGSLVAVGGSLLTGGRVAPVIVGVVVFGIFDTSTFWTETTSALGVSGAAGQFDPVGWALTLATLVLSALGFCWAASHLALAIRGWLRPAGQPILDVLAGKRPAGRGTARLLATGAAIVVAIVVTTTFGDLVNFSPDVHMLAGESAQAVPSTSPSTANPTPRASPRSSSKPPPRSSVTPSSGYNMVPGPIPGSLVTEGVLSSETPWAAHPPSGSSRIVSVSLPAPWTGGTSTTAQVDIYLPPGYPEHGLRYPVMYQAPFTLAHWTGSMQLPSVLDSLITSGAIPPQIFVFAAPDGGPYVDSECADSFDGREWFDRYMATTVVSYIDANYRTIPTAAARATFGYSQGGYCAATLMFRHPDVFGQAVSLSGYYEAGLASKSTGNAWKPFGRNPALIQAASPMAIVPALPKDVVSKLFVIMSADPNVDPYGPQISAFTSVLAANEVPAAAFSIPNAHSWTVVRKMLPTVLPMVSQRQLKLGVPIGAN